MKLYTKILGIMNALILLAGIVALVAFTIDEEEWLATFLFLIPIYFYSHYLIATKFGFKKQNSISKSSSIITIVLSVITFILIGIVPISTWNSYSKTTDRLKASSDWGQDTTVYNIRTTLKTKLIDNELEYVFGARFDDTKQTPEIDAFIIQFYDQDGFKVSTLEIESWTNSLDSTSTHRIGVSAYGSKSWYNRDDYQRIHDYNVAVRNK